MNPLVVDIVGSWARAGLAILGTWLIAHRVVTDAQGHALQESLFTQIMGYLPIVISLAWSTWNKYAKRLKIVTALASPAGTTEAQVEARVKAGNTPPVTLQKDQPPRT